MKEKLTVAFGTVGVIIFYLVFPFLSFAPLFFLDLPVIVKAVLMAVIVFVPFLNSIASAVIWVWALICCVTGEQSIFSFIFYVLFAFNVARVVFSFLSPSNN